MTTSTYYIVEAVCKEVKAFDGSILTKENHVAYLSLSEGYPSFDRVKNRAHKFDKPPSKEDIARWDGMPWYYRIKSAKIIHIEELLIHEIKELGVTAVV